MTELRDERGRLIYADRSNHGRAMDAMFPGPSRATRHAKAGGGMTPPHTLDGAWPWERDEGYSVPGGRTRQS